MIQQTMTPEEIAEWEWKLKDGTLFRTFRHGIAPLPAKSHGTRSRYTMGCRCDDCRAANAEYMRDFYRARRRAVREPQP